jgi:EAL domain-containing protein (putative c-di-GMP-specific phosphodiesterase class I)
MREWRRRLSSGFAIDDFGSGYDVMTQLQGLPVDLIKLDVRITGAGVGATRTEAMCQAVLEVCERIGLTVIAQGIATTGRQRRCVEWDARSDKVSCMGRRCGCSGEGGEGGDRKIVSSEAKDG